MPLDTNHLTSLISLLIVLSVASERLVEIIKGLVPWLNGPGTTPRREDVRKCAVQVLAVGAGCVTAWLAKDSVPGDVLLVHSWRGVAVLGLLASGGSGFWNSVLTYVLQVKNLKVAQATATPPTLPTAVVPTLVMPAPAAPTTSAG